PPARIPSSRCSRSPRSCSSGSCCARKACEPRMPIILAIEPDRRQRDALAAVVRQRVGAELILADTTERALEAIGNRVPDLVLVPALLSPQDDAALAAALRVIAAAAHVRTLTIPVLATEAKTDGPRGGLLSRWRRGRDDSQSPD